MRRRASERESVCVREIEGESESENEIHRVTHQECIVTVSIAPARVL